MNTAVKIIKKCASGFYLVTRLFFFRNFWDGHINIILPVVLYGYETWLLTLREERRPRVFQNWVLRRIFGPKREEVTGEWRKLHNEEHNDLYSVTSVFFLVIKSRRIRWAWHVACMEERGGVNRVLVGTTWETWETQT